MKLVVVESPFRHRDPKQQQMNINYAKLCVRDCIFRGEAPIASHLLIAAHGILDDANGHERATGIRAGHAWIPRADVVAVYTERGKSEGMLAGIEAALKCNTPVQYRRLILPDWIGKFTES
jgi:hypothetical protein